jgi:hypothetical protein
LDTTAHSIRFSGADRYQTNLATNLALRGKGGYPFSTPDGTEGWWGAGVCPRSVIVVAGDTFADALAAASLSDPGDRSSQPKLVRVAAADPVFDQIGATDRPDTASAPIVVTRSGRQGATGLSPTARATVQDFARGGCSLAREAIIVGGSASVPRPVEDDLLALGYREVFRVAGVDRYETAARVASALGTGSGTTATACLDPNVADGAARVGWYGNAVAEFRPDAATCLLLPRAVVLTDGGVGADALAAGWWTSQWQVPILLTAPDGSLPGATRQALQSLDISTVIVLGGSARIPEATVREAAGLAGGAATGRIAAGDRYATSVAMAEQFGGWWPTGSGDDFAGSMVCLTASRGDKGWPDALTAGPWCGAAGGAASNPGAPARELPPSDGVDVQATSSHVRPAHDAVPVILVPPGGPMPDVVSGFLAAAFDASAPWCEGGSAPPCTTPGFVVAFGGVDSISNDVVGAASTQVSGGRYVDRVDRAPSASTMFLTTVDLRPVFRAAGESNNWVCGGRRAVTGIRWLGLLDAEGSFDSSIDLADRPPFGADADGKQRSNDESVPFCVPAPDDVREVDSLRGISLSGHVTDDMPLGGERLSLESAVQVTAPAETLGLPSDLDPTSGGTTRWTFRGPVDDTTVTSGDEVAALEQIAVSLTLERGHDDEMPRPDVVHGAVTLSSGLGTVTGSLEGEGVLQDGVWRFRGRVAWSGGTWNVRFGSGGFAADVRVASPNTSDDDVLMWSADGLVQTR